MAQKPGELCIIAHILKRLNWFVWLLVHFTTVPFWAHLSTLFYAKQNLLLSTGLPAGQNAGIAFPKMSFQMAQNASASNASAWTVLYQIYFFNPALLVPSIFFFVLVAERDIPVAIVPRRRKYCSWSTPSCWCRGSLRKNWTTTSASSSAAASGSTTTPVTATVSGGLVTSSTAHHAIIRDASPDKWAVSNVYASSRSTADIQRHHSPISVLH